MGRIQSAERGKKVTVNKSRILTGAMRLDTLARASLRIMAAQLKPIELVILHALAAAERAGQPHTLTSLHKDVSKSVEVSYSSISRIALDLYQAGYTARRPVPGDRRAETHHVVREKLQEVTG